MKGLFWSCLALVAYTYLGYPVWLALRRRRDGVKLAALDFQPTVSVVLCVRNERDTLPAKLNNLERLDYPAGRLEIIVVSDGSDDGTDEFLRGCSRPRLRPVILPQRQGKAAALNAGVSAATGEIVVFTDARQVVEVDAVRHLVSNFLDAEVGCVSGELYLLPPTGDPSAKGLGFYWRYEKFVRQLESKTGSVVGATGALYAARRNLFVPPPPGAILDDVWIPMQTAYQGKRVIFDGRAQVWDRISSAPAEEFRRKVRTLFGNYQLVRLDRNLLSGRNPLLFEFVSHKLLRLLVPFALIGMMVGSVAAGPAYRIVFAAQLAFYLVGISAALPPFRKMASRPLKAVEAFLMLNSAAFLATMHFLLGKEPAWK